MSEVDAILSVAVELAFALLAVRTVASWFKQPDRRHGYLALAIGSLALLIVLSPALFGGGVPGQPATDLAIVLFLASGFGLLMFRDAFVPLGSTARRIAIGATLAAGLMGLAARLPQNADAPHSAFQSIAIVALLAVWAYCMLEPILTFWRASGGRPAVEKARLRAISIGYTGLLLVVVLGTVAGSAGSAVGVLLGALALATVPVLYVAFFPPTWLRRVWRQPEEDQFRHALHDLLLYSPDRATLANRALGWAERLVGGDSAFVLDADGKVLAARGLTVDKATEVASTQAIASRNAQQDGAHAPWRHGSALIVPLDLREGRGAMVIETAGSSPMFGDDEVSRLRQYSASITAGLDRVALNSRIAALERAKSDFLSIASHELRGPMTVIKGYLTMLESGALGEMSDKVHSVLPLLISKSDEVNWMIEQMIEASRLEEGKLALKRQTADIVELTDMAIDGIRMLLGAHHLTVDEPPEAIDADVDPDRFQIVIRNLLSNAAKYSPSGADIEVHVRRDGTMAFIEITDHGSGISKQDMPYLFTRFGRIESSSHVHGTGLGLWLSREIARMHEGDLTVQSELGQGSTFTFSVPITR